jgi:DNA (cytosine-5)-methyltransferase 1
LIAFSYYNEVDPYCAQWLRNLIDARRIAPGFVDERDIREVKPEDLIGFRQHHFFAGIAGWSLALQLAGWPNDRPIWTGSAPCQPFSDAGERKGVRDDRDLWPAWFALIRERKPSIVFGEQTSRAIGFGWFDRLSLDMEAEGYAVAAACLPACAAGSPQERERLWFAAVSNYETEHRLALNDALGAEPELIPGAHGSRLSLSEQATLFEERRRTKGRATPERHRWASESGLVRLAHGVPDRVAKIRALGNAIVPQIASEFVRAFL